MRFLTLLIVIQLWIPPLSAQSPGDLVKTQGIRYAIHKANIGRVIFTSRDIPLSALKPGDFLHHYVLTNKSNLFMTVFMGNSLTNCLHRLAPDWPADSLTRHGGYQFSLYIDHRLVYKSNILGAPYPQIKDTETTINKPLIDNDHEGTWWSQFFWGRFLIHGGDSALTEGSHLLRLEIRPYELLPSGVKEGVLIAAGDLPVSVNRKPKIDLSGVHLTPLQPYDGFGISKDGYDTNKLKQLKGWVEAGVFKHISSIVVIKNGKLLIEEYFNGEDRNSLHDPRSAGKSFASAMTGIAIREGYLKGEDQTLQEFYDLHHYANYTPEKETVRLKDLLTMSSAFDGDDSDGDSPGNEENMYPTDNWVKFTLDLPVSVTRPRDRWHYFTAGAMLMGDILNKSVQGGLEAYADLRLFSPLGIRDYQWPYTPQHVANTAGGIRLKALDFAKFGQLYKNNGVWNGQQIIPAEWVAKTFTKYKALPNRPDEYYGYLFWNKKYHVGDKAYETWYCAGNGGNKIFIFTDQPLVVVLMATAYGLPYAHVQEDRMMEEFILPAVLN
ncbi:serine hydrolase domain-containing protein [Dinghuibacter silviterrae]|uniref:CubicO group peptidase (Beta-lactamase class C family) n=1 Tax=Dinghuibacter silviterrae TaxID=1539049 RepID=A0A4R8DTB7_9BACT|nr:serine hydrolase [Dinghuibacter silviterrae]TDX01520.1 CubicO group peptidase (beta-lactamase class C family) [Dinghuibacter silviterrae]